MNSHELFKTISFNLRSLRLYWLNVLTMSVLIPLSYLSIVILLSPGSPSRLLVALIGFLSISVFSILVLPVASLVSSIFEENIVELYASLPIGLSDVVVSYALTYLVFSTPVITCSLIAIVRYANVINWPYLLTGLVYLLIFCSLTGMWLGLHIRNKLMLEPLLSILLLAVIVFTPAYYELANVPEPFKLITMVNPITHAINLMRVGVGVFEGIDTILSIAYLTLTVTALSVGVMLRLKKGLLTILEVR